MEDGIDIVGQSGPNCLGVVDVGDDGKVELGSVLGEPCLDLLNLSLPPDTQAKLVARLEGIEHDLRADEAGAAGDEDSQRHDRCGATGWCCDMKERGA